MLITDNSVFLHPPRAGSNHPVWHCEETLPITRRHLQEHVRNKLISVASPSACEVAE